MKRLRAAALAAGLTLLGAGCGASPTGPVDAGTVPGRPTTTGGPAAETTEVALYFTRGEKVERVSRNVPKASRIGAEALKALLAGPDDSERGAGFGTAIPAGTTFNDLTIDGGVARVDLSRTFESGGGSLGLSLRLAQVVCTLDAFDSVTGVRFALDGKLVDVLSGQGLVVDKPVSCATYQDYVAGTTAVFAGIWPFATRAQLDTYDGTNDQTYRDPAGTARGFADRYLGMTDPAVFAFRSTGPGAGEVPVGFRRGEGGGVIVNPQPTTVVQLRQLGRVGNGGPWTAVGATSADIEVEAPGVLARARSPLSLSGRARAFEGNVTVEVREDGMTFGQSLGSTFVTGRGDGVLGPFVGSVTFRQPGKPAGAVVFYERSAASGGTPVLRAAVVRVVFAT